MGFIHLGNVAHADEYWIEPSRVEHAPQGRADRNYDSVILVGSVCQNTFCLENTHDLERNAAYLNLPTDGVLPTQKRVLNARPQNRNPVCAQVVVIIDKTSLLEAKTAYVKIRRSCSQDHGGHREIVRLDSNRTLVAQHRC